MKTITTNVLLDGAKFIINEHKDGSYTITNEGLFEYNEYEECLNTLDYCVSINAIESLVLAHHSYGVDVTTTAYRNGLNQAIQELNNRF